MNGQPGSRSSHAKRRNRKPSYTRWAFDKGAKITVWWTLFTLVFRCPSTPADLTNASPVACKPYFHARDLLAPHVRPYYDQYLGPHLQRAQPYVDTFHTNVYKPGFAVYQQHGAPRVAQAQSFGVDQWERTIKPQLDVAKQHAGTQYDTTLAPHVQKAQHVIQPYYDSVKTSATDIWTLEVEPVYRRTAPYAQKFLTQGRQFAIQTALPHAQYAGSAAWSLWARQVWPRMRILYGENVEPQLMRITERLGRYKDGKKLEAGIKSMEVSSSLAEASVSVASVASSIADTFSEVTKSPAAATSITASQSPESTITPTEQFREDLKSWESVCSKAAAEGAEHLTEHLAEIADSQVSSQVEGTANALVIRLEETSHSGFSGVKARILSVVGGLPVNTDDQRLEEATTDVNGAIRSAGQSIKHSAQAVREWRQNYDHTVDDLVSKALESTLETIDNIREIRLSEIGRKYSDKDLPHKEWQKYNKVKKDTQIWRDDVSKVTNKNSDVVRAKAAAGQVEQQAMAIAEDSAKELARLKDVGRWKIVAGDATDDFETKTIPAAAERARKQVAQRIADASDAILGSSEQGIVESVTSAAADAATSLSSAAAGFASTASESVVGSSTGSVESLASKASEAILGSEQPMAESLTSKAKESAEIVATAVSEAVIGSESNLADTATDAASSISSAILGSETPGVESFASSVSSQAAAASESLSPKAASILAAGKARKDAASKSLSSVASEGSSVASSIVSQGSETAFSAADAVSSSLSSLSSTVSDAAPDASDLSSASAKASHKVFGGAMAQVLVEAREPILDDVIDSEGSFSESVQSMADVAAGHAARLTQAVADALKPATSTQGTVESVTSLANEQYESAMAAASSVLFHTAGAASKGSSAAREQYESAVTAYD